MEWMVVETSKEFYNQIKTIVGEPIYLVGGCVRDLLLGKEPKDYDFTTPKLPDEIEKAIETSGRHAYNIGKRFGTIGVRIDGQLFEITTFRKEEYLDGSRKPTVEFVQDITADLSRRDFTMNAIALRDGKIIDPFGGKNDLENKVIKAVGLPVHRIKEDPLRMLRAARFASQLGFKIDDAFTEATKDKVHRILLISKERWVMELDKLLMTDKPSVGLNFLMETRLINFMIPELSLQYKYDQRNPHHKYTLWEHTLNVVESTPKDLDLRWAALLHDIGKPFVRTEREDRSNYIKHDLVGADIVERLARHLKWSNDRREKVVKIVLEHLKEDSLLKQYDREGK